MKTNFKIRIKYETNKKCKQKDKSTQKILQSLLVRFTVIDFQGARLFLRHTLSE